MRSSNSRLSGIIFFLPLLIVLVPLHAVWPGAPMLLVFQTAALASSVGPPLLVHAPARRARPGVVFSLAFLLYPALEWVNLSEFHIMSLTVPLLSLTLYLLLEKLYRPFLVCALLLLLVKERHFSWCLAWPLCPVGAPAASARARPDYSARPGVSAH